MSDEKDIWGCFTICLQSGDVDMILNMGYLDKKDYYVDFGAHVTRITFVCDDYMAKDKISVKFNDKTCCVINKVDFSNAMTFTFKGQYVHRNTKGGQNAVHKKEAASLL